MDEVFHLETPLSLEDITPLKSGDRVVAARGLFGSCFVILDELLPRWGIHTDFVDGENLDDLLEPLETRIECLSQVISGIVPVLSDDHDAINGEILATKRERFGDGGEQAQIMAIDPLPSHVRQLVEQHHGSPVRQ